MRLKDRVAIVTGGGQGIGQAICLRLAEEGAKVAVADVNVQGSRDTERMIKEKGGMALVVPTDITKEEPVRELAKKVADEWETIDILVNNSGIAGPTKNIEDITLEEWEQTLAVNLRGMFLCCKHCIPMMKKNRRGWVVNISSVSGKQPLTQRTPYTTSKMGVIGLTRTLAAEVGRWGIRVNAICPGNTAGPRIEAVIRGVAEHTGKGLEEVTREFKDEAVLKCFVEREDIAAMVAFLCTEDSRMMTGQDINVSAGLLMY